MPTPLPSDRGQGEEGQLFFSMELISGPTLRELLNTHGSLPLERAISIVQQICLALSEAHGLPEPIIHRDLKPPNIFVEQQHGRDWVKVGDFGIAKVLSEHSSGLTQTGMLIGTPRYMAPEQWRGVAIDGRADLYAVGIMLYEMLLGQPPFRAEGGPTSLMYQHLEVPAPALPAIVPAGIRRVVEQLLAKEPAQRLPYALSVGAALEASLAVPLQPDEPRWITIPAGEFWMGSDEKDSYASSEEKPLHKVFVSEFRIAPTPVTNEQYQLYIQATGAKAPQHWKNGQPPQDKLDHPVVYVSWEDAQKYCQWLSKQTGKAVRLPTEAEWEKAARGEQDKRIYPWGDEFDKTKCNTNESGIGGTSSVGRFPNGASPYDCLDMSGNVWEWTQDWFDEAYYQHSPEKDPQGPDDGDYRSVRGGSFWYDQRFARVADRLRYTPGFVSGLIGFRCASS